MFLQVSIQFSPSQNKFLVIETVLKKVILGLLFKLFFDYCRLTFDKNSFFTNTSMLELILTLHRGLQFLLGFSFTTFASSSLFIPFLIAASKKTRFSYDCLYLLDLKNT